MIGIRSRKLKKQPEWRPAAVWSEFGERAVHTAKDVQHVAGPRLRGAAHVSAEQLSHAAERAASALAEAADRLQKEGPVQAGEAAHAARHRIADASEALAKVVRPAPQAKKKHRVRKFFIGGAVMGGIVALATSPLPRRLYSRIKRAGTGAESGAETEPESIALPEPQEQAPAPQPKPKAAVTSAAGTNGAAHRRAPRSSKSS